MVINKDYQIVALNAAYEQEYKISHNSSVGKMCYQVIRGKKHPCKLDGDECPHHDVFNCDDKDMLSPMHYDATHHSHQVKITAFPLQNANQELLLGKCVDEILPNLEDYISHNRMVGHSIAFKECINHLDVAANSDVPVFLQGDTGTGKELAAAYIHTHSSRSNAPFQIIDCTVLTEPSFESEMFGHANGAFSGCVGDKLGLYEMTDGGTMVFDKIGDLTLPLQSKLLRLLESGMFRRVGGSRMRSADVRVICATNQNLWELVSEGKFREDLYHRVTCLSIRIPTLAERIDDIPIIAQTLLDNINQENETAYYLLPEGGEGLKEYNYSGNIRELKNILYIATIQCSDTEIDKIIIENIISNMHTSTEGNYIEKQSSDRNNEIPSISQIIEQNNTTITLKKFEDKHIKELLIANEGNRKKTADALGISERTLYRKLIKLGINKIDD